MELSTTGERLDSFPAFYGTQIHKSSQPVPILGQTYPVHINPSHLYKIHLCLGLPTGPFLSGFPTNLWVPLLPHSCYMPRPSHPPWLDYSNYTWQTVQIMKPFIM
jgi:hypothetical protein